MTSTVATTKVQIGGRRRHQGERLEPLATRNDPAGSRDDVRRSRRVAAGGRGGTGRGENRPSGSDTVRHVVAASVDVRDEMVLGRFASSATEYQPRGSARPDDRCSPPVARTRFGGGTSDETLTYGVFVPSGIRRLGPHGN